jgi:Glycosyl transferase family 64 domain
LLLFVEMPDCSQDDDSLGENIALCNSHSELDSVTSNSSSNSSSDVNSLESSEDHSCDCSGEDEILIHPVYRCDDYDDHQILTSCEKGTMKKSLEPVDDERSSDCGCSVDTESLTNEPSLVSSYSIDETRGSVSPTQSIESIPEGTDHHNEWDTTNTSNSLHQGSSGDVVVINGQRQYDNSDVVYRSPAFPQLRHRRDYTTSLTAAIDETDFPVGGTVVDLSQLDTGLSPTAKHKHTASFGHDSTFMKGNPGPLKASFPSIFVQFVVTTYFVYYVLTVTSGDGVGFADSQWLMPSARSARKLIKKIEMRTKPSLVGAVGPLNGFTVRLRGERLDLLRRSIEHISRCSGVRQIQIDHDSPNDFPDEILSHESGKVVRMLSYNLAATATKQQQGSTDAILLLDEGLTLSCLDVERAFSEWKIDPVRAVGFFGYHDNTQSSSLLSDKAMFVHRLYLSPKNSSIMKVPVENNKCQHLALSAFVSSISLREPYLVSPASVVTNNPQTARSTGTNGISLVTSKSDDCVASIFRLAGRRAINSSTDNMYIRQPLLRRR